MRKLLAAAVVTAATLAAASPAAAQYYPGQPYGYGYDYRDPSVLQAQALAARINQVQRQVEHAAARGLVAPRTAYRLRQEIDILARDVRRASRHRLSPYEFRGLHARIAGLEQRAHAATGSGYRGRGGYNGYGGYNGGYNAYGYYDDGPLGDGIDDENN